MTVERGTITGGVHGGYENARLGPRCDGENEGSQGAGKAGLTVPDAVHVGDQVMVKYHEMKGTMMATDIQVRTPAPGAGSSAGRVTRGRSDHGGRPRIILHPVACRTRRWSSLLDPVRAGNRA